MAVSLGPQEYLERAKRGIYALKSGCIDKPGFAVDKQDAVGNTALLLACAEGAVDAAEIFLTLHACPITRNREGWSPILKAAHRGDVKLLTLLLEKLVISLDPSHVVPSTQLELDDPPLPPISYTCLQLCARYNHAACAEAILKHRFGGGWRAGSNAMSWTAMHVACAFNHPDVVRVLLSHGSTTADVLPFDSATALHMAVARHDAREILETLVEAGTDFRVTTIKGTTLMALARERKRPECARLLAELLDNSKPSRLRSRWQEAMTARTAEEASAARAMSLVLGSVAMSALPSALLTCTSLTTLDVSYNTLTALPIASLTNLRSLNVSHNQLARIPSSLVHLNQLSDLNLSHNPFQIETEKKLAAKAEIARIRDYLRGEGTEVPLAVMRLFIVGQEAVGKTSLLRCLRKAARERLGRGNDPTKDQHAGAPLSTDGIDIEAFTLLVADARAPERDRRTGTTAAQQAAAQAVAAAQGHSPVSSLSVSAAMRDVGFDYGTMGRQHKREVEVRAWDCAGQALYHSTHEWFVADAAVCIVAWDLRYPEANSRLEFWLRALQARTKRRIRVILVGTHLDDKLLDPAAVKKSLDAVRAKYTGSAWRRLLVEDVLALSCATSKGVPELRVRLEAVAASMLFSGPMIPRVVLDLEDSLVALARERERLRLLPVTPLDLVTNVAKRGWALSEANLPDALNALHALGSIVWLPATSALRGFVFLDAQWLTHALATVISTKNAFARKGILSHSDLRFLWRDYPVSLHTTLLRVLVQFEVLYPFKPVAPASSPPPSPSPSGHSPPVSPKLTRSGTVTFSGPLQAIGLNESPTTAEDTVDVTNVSLIPALLPEEPPDFSLVWPRMDPSKVQLTRNYYLAEMPTGLLSRLMVRLFSGAQVHAYWRNGLIVSRGSATLLVMGDPNMNAIRLLLRGPPSAPPVRLLRQSTELVELLLDNWYHLSQPRITVSCPHCLALSTDDSEEFELRQCEEEAAFGRPFVVCKRGNHPVRLDIIAPDVAMTDLSHAHIPKSELEIGAAVGKGSYGTVYKARHRGTHVAVKEIELPGLAQPDPSGKSAAGLYAEFRAECYLMMALRHPNVAQIRGFSLTPSLYIVMEFLDEGNLYTLLHDQGKSVSLALSLRMALDVAMGMRFLHHGLSPPLLHRDLKSPNVMIASLDPLTSVVAKVTDFGLSLHLHVDELRAKESKHRRVVNPTWLAPEVLNSENETTRSDVYAFGIILYEIFHRSHPFEEYAFRFAWQQEDAARKGVRPTLKMDNHSPQLKELLEQCWAQDPNGRPSFAQIVPKLGGLIATSAPQLPLERLLRDSLNPQVQVGGPAPPAAVTLSSRFVIPRPCTCITAAREQGEVWSGDADGALTPWDALSGKSGQPVEHAHGAAISSLQLVEAEGRSVLWSGAADGSLRVWRLRAAPPGVQRKQGEHGGYVDVFRPEANSGKRLQDVLAGKATPWFRCYAALDPTAAMLSLFRSAMERDLWRETYPLAGLTVEEVGEHKRRDHVLKLRLADSRELLLAFDTSGDKYAWRLAFDTASPMRARMEGSAPLTPSHSSAVVALAYVSSTGIVLSASQGSLRLNVWAAKNPALLREIEPLGQSGAGRTLSALLATDDLVCMVVERVVFVLDSQLTFLHGKPATRHAAKVATLVGERLWLADDVGLTAVDIRTGNSIFNLEIRGVAALLSVGDRIWLAAGNVLSLRDADTGVERTALTREHQSKVTQIVDVSTSLVWTIGADRIVCVWKR